MPKKLAWDASGEKKYETGVRMGVLYPAVGTAYPKGVAWNGLSGVTESPSGAEATAIYADDQKYLNIFSAEEFGGTIEAYMYPDEFAECDGSKTFEGIGLTIGQQTRKPFGLCYRTVLGNDTELENHGYKLHIIYGCMASPSEKSYSTINDSPEAINFSWEFKSTPVQDADLAGDYKAISCLTIDSTKATKQGLAALEKVLYGSDEAEARLPLPSEIKALLETQAAG